MGDEETRANQSTAEDAGSGGTSVCERCDREIPEHACRFQVAIGIPRMAGEVHHLCYGCWDEIRDELWRSDV